MPRWSVTVSVWVDSLRTSPKSQDGRCLRIPFLTFRPWSPNFQRGTGGPWRSFPVHLTFAGQTDRDLGLGRSSQRTVGTANPYLPLETRPRTTGVVPDPSPTQVRRPVSVDGVVSPRDRRRPRSSRDDRVRGPSDFHCVPGHVMSSSTTGRVVKGPDYSGDPPVHTGYRPRLCFAPRSLGF